MTKKNEITIKGETTSISHMAHYLPSQWKSNDIETMQDFREIQEFETQQKDYKWIIYIGFASLLAMVGLVILLQSGAFSGGGGGGIDYNALSNAIQGTKEAASQGGASMR